MAASDEQLISRALIERDTEAFDQLVQRHQSRVRGWLRHLSGDPALADDLAQDSFLAAWQRLTSFKATGSFEAWLLTIARNQFLQHCRKTRRETGKLDRLRVETETLGTTTAQPPTDTSDASRFLGVLGATERDLMTLVYGIGLSHAEASEVSGLPLGTVKSHIRRGVGKIRKHFAPAGG